MGRWLLFVNECYWTTIPGFIIHGGNFLQCLKTLSEKTNRPVKFYTVEKPFLIAVGIKTKNFDRAQQIVKVKGIKKLLKNRNLDSNKHLDQSFSMFEILIWKRPSDLLNLMLLKNHFLFNVCRTVGYWNKSWLNDWLY